MGPFLCPILRNCNPGFASLKQPLDGPWRYIRTYKPVLDDAVYRSFDTTEDYRTWCEENLPEWLGYGRI